MPTRDPAKGQSGRRRGEEARPASPRDESPTPTKSSLRLFVAVPLTDVARMTVGAIVDDIKAELTQAAGAARSEVRWVRMDGLHLTLRFLGATPSERVGELAGAIDAVAADARPFEIRIAGAGAFPSPTRPRTLWLGITAGKNELKALAAALDAHLEALGWQPEERSFRSHLTLARADGRREGPAAARLLIDRAADVELAFRADNLVLFESVTGSGPARYEPLHVAPLGGAV